MKYSIVDLFAGAGGLSLGFIQTNKFEIKVAIENNKNAQKTYKRNHNNVEIQNDVCVADYNDITKRHGNIDVVIGGPPCQGFSNANRQKNHTVSLNNMMVKQYVRAISELKPKVFVLENVSMLTSKTHRFYMEIGEDEFIEKHEINTSHDMIELISKEYADESFINIVKDKVLINKYLWDDDIYSILNVVYKYSKNIEKLKNTLHKKKKVFDDIISRLKQHTGFDDLIFQADVKLAEIISRFFDGEEVLEDIIKQVQLPVTIQRMLNTANEITNNKLLVDSYDSEDGIVANVRSYTIFDYIEKVLGNNGNGYTIESDIMKSVEFGTPQKRMRFVAIGVRKDISKHFDMPIGTFQKDKYFTVKDAILDLLCVSPRYDVCDDEEGIELDEIISSPSNLTKKLRDSSVLHNHIITRSRETALERFSHLKQGENFHDLDSSMKINTYTDVNRTQNTIYLRLKYDEPSGTVVNVRKSMWIHPELNRAISIREAARLQTFPDSFIFVGTKDSQYQQVGNAVPPFLAKAIADKVIEILDK